MTDTAQIDVRLDAAQIDALLYVLSALPKWVDFDPHPLLEATLQQCTQTLSLSALHAAETAEASPCYVVDMSIDPLFAVPSDPGGPLP